MSDTTGVPIPGAGDDVSALPLTLLDEALLHLQEARAQWNVQLELDTGQHIDETALRKAVFSCCRRHPLTRARLGPWKRLESSYRWHITDELDLDPVRVVECPDSAALARIRAEIYTPALDLEVSPAMRIVLARRPGGDLVLMSVSHLVADGVGAVRLMQSIARAYRGEPDPPDPLPLEQARDLGSFLTPRTRGEKWARQLEAVRRFREAVDSPSRIAVAGGTDQDGFGFTYRELELGAATTPTLTQRERGITINDVLLAALHLTVADWNRAHEVPTDRVGVMMPVNIRPADRFWEVVSNLTSMVTVSTVPEDRADLATAAAAVSAQTNEVGRENRANGLYDLLDATKKTPLALKRLAPRLLPHTGDRFVDTAMLSNLGRIPQPPTLGDDPDSPATRLWFSPPCDPTCSVAIGIATCDDQLTLVTRYRHEQFDAAAAESFTDSLISRITGKNGR